MHLAPATVRSALETLHPKRTIVHPQARDLRPVPGRQHPASRVAGTTCWPPALSQRTRTHPCWWRVHDYRLHGTPRRAGVIPCVTTRDLLSFGPYLLDTHARGLTCAAKDVRLAARQQDLSRRLEFGGGVRWS